ncbi:MAG: hypothetical protein NC399_10535 [Muribaculum sp.]|nr:hypothetical protein [Muribaculum sp.]
MDDNRNGMAEEAAAREALEEAREAEGKAYRSMRESAFTERQKGVMELAGLEEKDVPERADLDRKCRLLLECYYLPQALQEGGTVKLDAAFTRSGDSGRDYIEAVFTDSSGRKRSAGYQYKVDEDGKSLILFEKTFENVVVEPGKPEKYVLLAEDGETVSRSFSVEELQELSGQGEIVKADDVYFCKARNAAGELCEGETTVIVDAAEESRDNVRVFLGDNEQERYSIGKTGQLVCSVTNDVTTVIAQTRKIASGEPIYDSADAARAAAEQELQEGEGNLKVDVNMEGTTVAEFDFIPVYTTSVELSGISRKLGKGVEGFDASESDEENLRRQFAKPISEYLDEKGFHVIDISCENLEADVTENVGWMNTIKTFQMKGGMVTVSYTKRYTATVSLKQGFRGRGQNNDTSVILSQLPEGSELLNPEQIDWKNSKPEVSYVMRGSVTAQGSAKTIAGADDLAVENAVLAAQKIAARGLNGGISAGIKEVIYADKAASTLVSVRARLDVPSVGKADMRLSHKDAKYAYEGTCEREVASVENKLVSVTVWDGSSLVYVPPTDPVIDKGIPTDDNYDRYVTDGDDSGILVFEKTDPGLRRYIEEVRNAQAQAEASREAYEKARRALREAQEAFDRIYDGMDRAENVEIVKSVPEEAGTLESVPEEARTLESVPEEAGTLESVPEEAELGNGENPDTPEEPAKPLTAHEALLAIFGDDGTE